MASLLFTFNNLPSFASWLSLSEKKASAFALCKDIKRSVVLVLLFALCSSFCTVFSGPYLSNRQGVVMVVIRPFVTDVLWLNGAR